MGATLRERELEEENRKLREKIVEQEAKIKRLEELLNKRAKANASKGPKINYSLERNGHLLGGGKKRKRRGKSTGRRPAAGKSPMADQIINVYPNGVEPKHCVFRATQFGWRFIDGKAVYVRYDLHAPSDAATLPTPPGMRNRRSEFGSEIIISLAYLHYWIGMSIDNARQVMTYFTGLELSKSQADSLLNQLANDWHDDYDSIVELIAMQMLVYVDETGWKVGDKSCYTWAFSCVNYVLFRCGVGRGKEQAEQVLGNDFAGIGVSDDYAAYDSLFGEHQLCWAHFIRKAIKIALQDPNDTGYKDFLDGLYAIFCQAKRYRDDSRLTIGRAEKVEELKQAILNLCTFADTAVEEDMAKSMEAFILLQRELVDNLDCLFVFVEHPEVEPTNNRSERNVRREAEVRKGGRTSKTDHGAQRRSVIMTIFATLRTRIQQFTLESVLDEIRSWVAKGRSIFQEELATAQTATG